MHTFVVEHLKHYHLSRRGEITAALTIKAFGLSFVSIFIPIYLYNLGYSLQEILIYFIIDYGLRGLLQPAMGWYIGKFGPKHGLLISALSNVVLMALLATQSVYQWPLFLLAAVSAVTFGFHFLAAFVDLALLGGGKKHLGRRVGQLTQAVLIATAIGPVAGGYIGSLYGLAVSLVIACSLVVLSMVPLILSHEPHVPRRISLKSFPYSAILPDVISMAGRGIDNRSANVLWPFAVFLVLGSIAEVGALTSLTFVIVLVGARLATSLADRHARRLIKLGSAFTAALHVLRVTAMGPLSVGLINVLEGMAHWLGFIPWQAAILKRSKDTDPIAYYVILETASNMVSVLYWTALLGLSYFFSTEHTLAAGFIIAALAVLFVPQVLRGGKLHIVNAAKPAK